LDSLVQNLGVEEIRRLRTQLNAITLPNDISLLPIELLLCIAQHLELLDVITLRSVSRAWSETFSSADFSIGLIKIHFRPVWESRSRVLAADQQQVEKRVLMEWLRGATRRRIRRQNGRYQSMSINRRSYNRVSARQYKNGRVAFKQGPGAILVEDIRTSLGAKYIDENRIDFGEWLLSEDFLLAATNGP
jgi:F-box domain